MTEVYDGAIGIDLGTTSSCVAYATDISLRIIPNEHGNLVTPSVVSFTDKGRLYGEAAELEASTNSQNTTFDVKRLIGRHFEDPAVKEYIESCPCRMKMLAENYLGMEVSKAVITVPAYFNDNQRQATKDAGAIAGFNVLRIVNESAAAAIAYSLDYGKHEKERNILIYDLGGGTLDVTLLNIQDDVLTVKATAGDTHLGGRDFDTNLLQHLKQEFQRKSGKDLSGDSRALQRLRTHCELAKRSLSSLNRTSVEMDSLFEGEDFYTHVTRDLFEDLNAKAFASALEPVQQVLKDSGIDKSKVDEIVCVGGSTRIPRIQKLLSDFFDGKKLENSVDPDKAIAYGAAIYASVLSGQAAYKGHSDLLLSDIVPISLGIAVDGNIFTPVIPRGQTIPTIKTHTFSAVDNQETLQFSVYQGEHANCEDNTLLGKFTFALIPPMKAGEAALDVVFEVDVNGILKVTAAEKYSGHSIDVTISNAVGMLSSIDIAKFKINNKADKARQQLDMYIVEAEQVFNDLQANGLGESYYQEYQLLMNEAEKMLENSDTPLDELEKQGLAIKSFITGGN
ncbi:hypothetical protein BBP40_005983 [Aspergillus hancockii]|nr:hypothetical protein BBP40_005983 [Aspergillus hancockii]